MWGGAADEGFYRASPGASQWGRAVPPANGRHKLIDSRWIDPHVMRDLDLSNEKRLDAAPLAFPLWARL
jgi:hypothetical protein